MAATAPPAKSTPDTVTVACKLPNGLHLSLRDTHGREIWGHTVAGNAVRRHQETMAPLMGGPVVEFGYALTPGVNGERWEEWLTIHKHLPAVANGLIFANGSAADVRVEAQVMEEIKSGFEPMDPTYKGDGLEPMVK